MERWLAAVFLVLINGQVWFRCDPADTFIPVNVLLACFAPLDVTCIVYSRPHVLLDTSWHISIHLYFLCSCQQVNQLLCSRDVSSTLKTEYPSLRYKYKYFRLVLEYNSSTSTKYYMSAYTSTQITTVSTVCSSQLCRRLAVWALSCCCAATAAEPLQCLTSQSVDTVCIAVGWCAGFASIILVFQLTYMWNEAASLSLYVLLLCELCSSRSRTCSSVCSNKFYYHYD